MTKHLTTPPQDPMACPRRTTRASVTVGSASLGHVALLSAIALGGVASFTAFGGGLRDAIVGGVSGATGAATGLGDAHGLLAGGAPDAHVTVGTEAAGIGSAAHAARAWSTRLNDVAAFEAWARHASDAELDREWTRAAAASRSEALRMLRGRGVDLDAASRMPAPERTVVLRAHATRYADALDARALRVADLQARRGDYDSAFMTLRQFDEAVAGARARARRPGARDPRNLERWYERDVTPRRAEILARIANGTKDGSVENGRHLARTIGMATDSLRTGDLPGLAFAEVMAIADLDALMRFAEGSAPLVTHPNIAGVFPRSLRISDLPKDTRDAIAIRTATALAGAPAWKQAAALELLDARRASVRPALREALADAYLRLGKRDTARRILAEYYWAHPDTLLPTPGASNLELEFAASQSAAAAARLWNVGLHDAARAILERAFTATLDEAAGGWFRRTFGHREPATESARRALRVLTNALVSIHAGDEAKRLFPRSLREWGWHVVHAASRFPASDAPRTLADVIRAPTRSDTFVDAPLLDEIDVHRILSAPEYAERRSRARAALTAEEIRTLTPIEQHRLGLTADRELIDRARRLAGPGLEDFRAGLDDAAALLRPASAPPR